MVGKKNGELGSDIFRNAGRVARKSVRVVRGGRCYWLVLPRREENGLDLVRGQG